MGAWLTLTATVGLATGVRWLRVAQREHYLAPSVTRFAWRWWSSSTLNRALASMGFIGVVAVWWYVELGWLALLWAVGPIGLSWRGRTSKLVWTPRLIRLAVASGLLSSAGVIASLMTDRPGFTVAALVLVPLLIDVALVLIAPLERQLGQKWVSMATTKLQASRARVVAITGSYGKTTTKGYVVHLLSGRMAVVVSPASFNNRMGLARAINEHLAPGTEVFVAEMGTYGKGEIADLCAFIPPEVAVITAIGPVHLERFGSEEQIAEAKREILADAKVAVICIDHPLLEKLASAETRRRKVVRVSAFDESADVAVIDGAVTIQGRVIGNVGADVFRSNLACAIAVALHFEVPIEDIERRLVLLPGTSHRREVRQSERGFAIVDDTYNSNPAGARLAVEALGSLSEGRRVVVTPGMVELGPVQFDENRKLAAEIGAVATDLVVVGVTNRRALLEGSKDGSVAVTVVGSRDEAADWVRSTLGPGDAVLYENDLPDHYP